MEFAPGHAPGHADEGDGSTPETDVKDVEQGNRISERASTPIPEGQADPSDRVAQSFAGPDLTAEVGEAPTEPGNRVSGAFASQEDSEADTQLWLREALDAVATLGTTFQTEQASGATPETVFKAARQALLRVADFGSMGIVFADEEGLVFELDLVEPEDAREAIQKELDLQIAEGTFSWALYQDRPVIVPGQYMGKSVLMHVLATPSKIGGMFFAALDEEHPFIPEMGQMVLSILMQNCAGVLESGALYRELAEHNFRLEQTVRERTAELKKSEEAALAAAKAKGDFLANMSHEIRTPINGVLGMTGLLLESELSNEQREFAEATERSAQSLLMLINDLLDFSKIEAGSLTLEEVPLDLRLVIDDIGELLAPQAIAKGIELGIRYAPGTERYFVGDPGRIRQIVTNLAGNAVKFTSEGHVLITVESTTDGSINIAVEDTGIGIPAHAVDRIFEKFEQADLSTTRKHGGTGLGLAICRELAELMGGEVGVTSEEGVGSVFSARIKLNEDEAAQGTSHDGLAEDAFFFIASPSELIRDLVDEQLRAYGGTVHGYATPQEVLHRLFNGLQDEQQPTAIFIDQGYGDEICSDFARAVRKSEGSTQTPLVRLTPGHLTDRNDDNGFAFDMAKPLLERRWVDAARRLGLRDAKDAVGTDGPSDEEVLASGRVLLVEDNLVNRTIAMRLLEKMGVQATFAENGEQAVEAYQDGSFDLILMDCQMPVMDGYDATRTIREAEGATGRHIPIVALTASAMESDRQKCMEAGMDAFLSKPLTVDELRAAVVRWLTPEVGKRPN